MSDAEENADVGGAGDVQPAPDGVADATAVGSETTGVPQSDTVRESLGDADAVVAAKLSEMQELVDERTEDLQRLHAEYANYKKRVDRDRSVSRQGGIESVILDLLPVLDSVEAAREHDELVGGFKLVADELEKITAKYGLVAFGDVGEAFDPQIHEALMQMPMDGELEGPTVAAVMQRGVRLNDRVIRPARVGVADPENNAD